MSKAQFHLVLALAKHQTFTPYLSTYLANIALSGNIFPRNETSFHPLFQIALGCIIRYIFLSFCPVAI
jgi:hypothetical protein